jgi:hypothetical protein
VAGLLDEGKVYSRINEKAVHLNRSPAPANALIFLGFFAMAKNIF